MTLELGEPRVVVGVHQLQVRDGVAAVGVAVGLARDLVAVERCADGAVADGVGVHLPSGLVQDAGERTHGRAVDVEVAVVVGGVAVGVEVGLEQRGGLGRVLDHAVHEDLDDAEVQVGHIAVRGRESSRPSRGTSAGC